MNVQKSHIAKSSWSIVSWVLIRSWLLPFLEKLRADMMMIKQVRIPSETTSQPVVLNYLRRHSQLFVDLSVPFFCSWLIVSFLSLFFLCLSFSTFRWLIYAEPCCSLIWPIMNFCDHGWSLLSLTVPLTANKGQWVAATLYTCLLFSLIFISSVPIFIVFSGIHQELFFHGFKGSPLHLCLTIFF